MPKASKAKKLISVLATSASVSGASKEAQKGIFLDRVPCIYHPVQFWKDQRATIQALNNSGSKINAMTPAYAKKLGLRTRKTDIGAQKIYGSLLKTYGMVIAAFQVKDKLGRARVF